MMPFSLTSFSCQPTSIPSKRTRTHVSVSRILSLSEETPMVTLPSRYIIQARILQLLHSSLPVSYSNPRLSVIWNNTNSTIPHPFRITTATFWKTRRNESFNSQSRKDRLPKFFCGPKISTKSIDTIISSTGQIGFTWPSSRSFRPTVGSVWIQSSLAFITVCSRIWGST